jgi:succinate dehydrogenase / fumarate reductase iron-sulfur subunit
VFRVFRYDSDADAPPRFDTFRLDAPAGTTVLDALFRIQQEHDPSLAFRFSCRGAVCGSCGMTINGRCGLACRTQLATLPHTEVILEPLPHLDVLADLVVDMTPFWEKYRSVRPWLHAEMQRATDETEPAPIGTRPGTGDAAAERRQSPRQVQRIDQYTNCILCACCYGACPVLKRQPDYIGPAALAKLLRFVDDSRDQRSRAELVDLDNEDKGVWGCDTVYRCIDACPKDVRPTDGIAALRRRLLMYRIRRRS